MELKLSFEDFQKKHIFWFNIIAAIIYSGWIPLRQIMWPHYIETGYTPSVSLLLLCFAFLIDIKKVKYSFLFTIPFFVLHIDYLYLCIINGYTADHTIGLFLILYIYGIFFTKNTHMITFYFLLMIPNIIFVSGIPMSDRYATLSGIITIYAFSMVSNYMRITAQMKAFELRDALSEQNDKIAHNLKIEAVNGLVTTLSHEINNPVQLAINYMEDLQESINICDKDLAIDAYKRVEIAVKKISTVVSAVRSLSSDLVDEGVKDNSANKILETIEELIGTKIANHNILLILDKNCESKDIIIKCNFGETVFNILSMVNNSIESLVNHKTDSASIAIYFQEEVDYIDIIIEDNGIGVSEDHIKKLFKPFFTTKDGHSGIGLFLAKNSIERRGGSVFYFKSATTNFVLRFNK